MAVDAGGNVYVADTGNHSGQEDARRLRFRQSRHDLGASPPPYGVAADASGNVYIADFYSATVNEFMAAGGYTTVNALGGGSRRPQGEWRWTITATYLCRRLLVTQDSEGDHAQRGVGTVAVGATLSSGPTLYFTFTAGGSGITASC